MLFLVDEMNIGDNKIKKIGNRKSACEVIVRTCMWLITVALMERVHLEV